MKKVLDHLSRMRLMEVYAWVIKDAKKHYTDNEFFECDYDGLSDDMKDKLGFEPRCVLMHLRHKGCEKIDLIFWMIP